MIKPDSDDSMEWIFKGGVAGLALVAFCMQPLLPFVEPSWFLFGGLFFGAGVCATIAAYGMPAASPWSTRFCIALAIAGLTTLAVVTSNADTRSAANDRRCLTIERDMLSVSPKIANGPDVFQALRCRPQTKDQIGVALTVTSQAAGILPEGPSACQAANEGRLASQEGTSGSGVRGSHLPTLSRTKGGLTSDGSAHTYRYDRSEPSVANTS